jgi:hypothetical protein
MSFDAQATLRQGLAIQTERVAALRKQMEQYRFFYEHSKRDYEVANEILERMQKLAK